MLEFMQAFDKLQKIDESLHLSVYKKFMERVIVHYADVETMTEEQAGYWLENAIEFVLKNQEK